MPVSVSHLHGIQYLDVTHAEHVCQISLFGGQLTHLHLNGHDVLWLTRPEHISTDRAIRGGVPICWPWFGPKQDEKQHGIARTSVWDYQVESDDDTATSILLTLPTGYNGLQLKQRITLSENLTIELITDNTEKVEQGYTAALHTYFSIDNIEGCEVKGVGSLYVDKLLLKTISAESTDLQCHNTEMDRIYTAPESISIINNKTHKVIVEHSGNDSVVCWNPGAKAESVADIEVDDQPHFVCVETAITGDTIRIPPLSTHTLTQIISVR